MRSLKELNVRKEPLTNREFVITYLRSSSSQEVAKTLNLSKQSVNNRARELRKAGVNLPKMARKGITALEVDELNTIISKYESEKLKAEKGI